MPTLTLAPPPDPPPVLLIVRTFPTKLVVTPVPPLIANAVAPGVALNVPLSACIVLNAVVELVVGTKAVPL